MAETTDAGRRADAAARGAAAGYLFAFLAGCTWGTTGLFVRFLQGAGMNPLAIVLWRTLVASHGAALFFLLFDRRMLAIERRDIPFTVLTGVLAVVFTQYSFIYSVSHTSLAIAVVLNYTSPLFVAVLSRMFFGEPITLRKAAALVVSAAGLVLILRLYDPGSVSIGSALAAAAGLASGFFYAVQCLMSKRLVSKYHPLTVNTWVMLVGGWALYLVGAITATPVALPAGVAPRLTMLLFAAGPGTLAFYLFLSSLRLVQATRASIMTMVEPVVAALFGFFLVGEPLTYPQVAGIGAIMSAILLASTERR